MAQFTNLLAMQRKPYYVTANVFSANFDLSWIPSVTEITIEPSITTPDGTETDFTFVNVPRFVLLNGLLQFEGTGYTRSGNTVTFTTAPAVDDDVRAIC